MLRYAIAFAAGMCAGALIDRRVNKPVPAPPLAATYQAGFGVKICPEPYCTSYEGHGGMHYNGAMRWAITRKESHADDL